MIGIDDALIIGGIGAATSALGSGLSYYGNRVQGKRSANQQNSVSFKRSALDALLMPTFEKQGLINAGINPILAYGSIGGSSGFNVSSSGWSGSFDNPVSSALASANSYRQNQLGEEEVKQAKLTTEILSNEKEKNDIETLVDMGKYAAEYDALFGTAHSGFTDRILKQLHKDFGFDSSHIDPEGMDTLTQAFKNLYKSESLINSPFIQVPRSLVPLIPHSSKSHRSFYREY